MRSTIIHNTDLFNLTSYGNGLAYCLAHKTQCREVFVQGDDAGDFREAWEAIDANNGGGTLNHVLSRLWGMYAEGEGE